MHSGLIQAKSDFNTSEISEVEQICGGEDISEKELEKKEKSMYEGKIQEAGRMKIWTKYY